MAHTVIFVNQLQEVCDKKNVWDQFRVSYYYKCCPHEQVSAGMWKVEEREKQGRPGNTYPHDVIHVIGVPRLFPFFALFRFQILIYWTQTKEKKKTREAMQERGYELTIIKTIVPSQLTITWQWEDQVIIQRWCQNWPHVKTFTQVGVASCLIRLRCSWYVLLLTAQPNRGCQAHKKLVLLLITLKI